ncbi:hypothetical protein [Novosphingobium sp. Gsoil 351]|uniref:hypothetical protein n=1 Tax=Novosphingobium sp. Gsoil 351 TaxID=2675225 RepID=UPI0012B47A9D|nr:hypothetical protein [Novosphingobium sp. Gsoil 351]QGN56192.1 hypothetical protein GKE62_18205 [Novosphingobium sp. Gsoil 351]
MGEVIARALACAAVLTSLALADCGKGNAGKDEPIRVPLATVSAAAKAPVATGPAGWTHAQSARAAWFGPADAPALLAISCEGWEKHAARLLIVRFAAADKGAQALFAIQGSKGILRLPVSAVKIGKQGYVWRGILDAADPRAEVLLGAGLKATVPGGGELILPPMGVAGAVVSECVSAAAQTLPNRASNPATSPAAR